MFVIANETGEPAFIDGLPGYPSTYRLESMQGDKPTYLTLHLTPGQYDFPFGWGTLTFTIEPGEMKMAQLFRGQRPRPNRLPEITQESYIGNFEIPYGCLGGIAPTLTPAPRCPAWFITPAANAATLIIENRLGESLELLKPDTKELVTKVPASQRDSAGYASLALAPGHHEFEVSTGKQIVVDLPAGGTLVAVHPPTRFSPALLPLVGAVAPFGCPGHVPPTPTPPPQCPDWY